MRASIFGRSIAVLVTLSLLLLFERRLFAQAKLEYAVTLENVHREKAVWLRATLRNTGDEAVRVYWGDRAHPDMYRFAIVHVESGRRIPTLENSFSRVVELNRAGDARYFRTLTPGSQIDYQLVLGGVGANTQHVLFRDKGEYRISPSLHVITDLVISDDNDRQTPIWTGDLEAAPIVVDFGEVKESIDRFRLIGGRVVSADGQPVPEAAVQLRYSTEPQFHWRSAKEWDNTYTDQNGAFEFLRVPEDAEFSLTVTHKDHGRGYLEVGLESLRKGVAPEVQMPRMERFAGRVVDEDGKGVNAVRVNQTAYTDRDGHFAFNVMRRDGSEFLDVSLWKRAQISFSKRIPWEEVTEGKTLIKVLSPKSRQVIGQAMFADGKPASDCKIQFELLNYKEVQQAPNFRSQVSATTDGSGGFVLSLPDDKLYRAKAVIEKKRAGEGVSRSWSCEVTSLQAGKRPLQLLFDNRGSIICRLFQLGEYRSKGVALTCVSMSTGKNVAWGQFNGDVAGHVYSDLEPGKYKISARLQDGGSKHWETEVTVPDVEPFRALAVIKIPKVILGSVAGRLILPDGKTPASNFSIRLGGQSVTTDAAGKFLVADVPAGGQSCIVISKDGLIIDKQLYATVVAGEETALGDLQLVREADEFGWFEGELAYENGTEVEGYCLLGVFDKFPYGQNGMSAFPINALGEVRKRTRSRRGKKLAVFDIYGTGRPRNAMSGGFGFVGEKVEQAVVLNVEIEGGKVVQQTAFVPRRLQCRALKVTWPTEDRPYLAVVVPLGEAAQTIYELRSAGYLRYEDSKPVLEEKEFEFQSIAKGDGFLIANSGGTKGFFTIVPFQGDQKTIAIQPKEFAKLEVDLVDSANKPVENALVQISTELLGHDVSVGWNFSPGIFFNSVLSSSLPNGHLRALSLGPGTYKLDISYGGSRQLHQIELEPNSHSKLRFVIDDDGSIRLQQP